jgi:hypothetical protein
VDGAGDLARSVGDGIAGLIGGAFRAFGAAVQGVFDVLQSLLPGLWLPVVAIALVLVVGWSLIKR